MFGIVRQMLMAQYLGASDAADAFTAAFKIPNFLQNLFGEGALSASFIPGVLATARGRATKTEAGRVAGAVFALLALVVSVLVLLGVVRDAGAHSAHRQGFKGEKRELTIRLTRILFPGAGLFVHLRLVPRRSQQPPAVSAVVRWRRSLWNIVMIAALLVVRRPRHGQRDLVGDARAWASVVGRGAAVPRAAADRRCALVHAPARSPDLGVAERARRCCATSCRSFVSRGVVQISSYIDHWLATFLPDGMVATFGYASTIFVLAGEPVRHGGLGGGAAGDVARRSGDEARASRAQLRERLDADFGRSRISSCRRRRRSSRSAT